MTDGLIVTIDLNPWFTTLTKELAAVLAKCVDDGMPIDAAEEILRDALSHAVRSGVNARPLSK